MEWQPRSGSAIAEAWWRELTSDEADGRISRGTKRKALAVLRRADTPLEVMQEPEALRLIARLPDEDPDRVAILAGILAFVRESDDRRVASAIGRASLDDGRASLDDGRASLDDDKSAIMSESRFRRLMRVPGDELMETMRRLVRLTGGKANVRDLSFAVLRWGDGVKKRWIFDYYGVHGESSHQ